MKLLSSLIGVILLAYFRNVSNIYVFKLHICIKFYSDYYCRAITSDTIKLSMFLDVHTFLIKTANFNTAVLVRLFIAFNSSDGV